MEFLEKRRLVLHRLIVYIYGVCIVGSVGVYVRVDRRLLEEFTRLAHRLGMSRSEAIRRAMEMFLERYRGRYL